MKKDIAIIGGGIIGLCCAYYLQKAGASVTILDRKPAPDQSGCSFGNAGMIVPSHIIPLAAPGVISQGIRWMFKSDSPFYIHPRLDMNLIAWLWLFYRSANKGHVERGSKVLKDMGLQSRKAYLALKEEAGLEIEIGEKGLMMLFKTGHMGEEEAEAAHLAKQLGMPAKVLNKEEVQAMEPNVELDVMGGVHYPMDMHLNPATFVESLRKNLLENGVEIRHKIGVESLEQNGKQIKHIQSSKGSIKADQYILAAGSWSPTLLKGMRLPLLPGKGYSLTAQSPLQQFQTPSILCEAKVAVTPMGKSLRFAGTLAISPLDEKIQQKRLQGMVNSISDFVPAFSKDWLKMEQAWTGLRPCTPDGLPYIGKSKRLENLLFATGHAMLGMSLGPVTGQMIADIAAEKTPEIELDMLSPDRF